MIRKNKKKFSFWAITHPIKAVGFNLAGAMNLWENHYFCVYNRVDYLINIFWRVNLLKTIYFKAFYVNFNSHHFPWQGEEKANITIFYSGLQFHCSTITSYNHTLYCWNKTTSLFMFMISIIKSQQHFHNTLLIICNFFQSYIIASADKFAISTVNL